MDNTALTPQEKLVLLLILKSKRSKLQEDIYKAECKLEDAYSNKKPDKVIKFAENRLQKLRKELDQVTTIMQKFLYQATAKHRANYAAIRNADIVGAKEEPQGIVLVEYSNGEKYHYNLYTGEYW